MRFFRSLLTVALLLCVSLAKADVIIIDNSDTTSGFTSTGTWSGSTSNSGYYGSNYVHNNQDPNSTATYTPNLPTGGTWGVWALWTSSNNRETAVPYTVNYDGGSDILTRDQNFDGGVWQKLGDYSFLAGSSGNVVISAVDNSGYVVADAIAFSNGGGADSGYIDPTTLSARASSYISTDNRQPIKAVNGAGMHDEIETYHDATTNGKDVNWLSAASAPANCWFQVDLGQEVQLGTVKVWNYTANNGTTRDVKLADVYVSTLVSPSTDLTNAAEWTLVMDDVTFNQVLGNNINTTPEVLDFGATGVTARWFALDILENYGDSSYTGLAELRFYPLQATVPEPGTLVLVLSGGLLALGLGRFRRPGR